MILPRRATALALALFLLAVPVLAASWSIGASGSIGTPAETVTVEGETVTISSVSRVDGGGLSVSVQTTSDDRYQINLYDNEKNVVDFRTVQGSTTVSFDTGGLAPGTYVVGAIQDGPQAVQPVVVAGVSVDVSTPSAVRRNEPLEIEATLQDGGSVSVSSVEAVLWNGDTRTSVGLTRQDDGTYRGTVTGLEPGDYRLNVGVRGVETIEGERQLVGIESGGQLSVLAATTTTPTPTPTPTTTRTPPPTVTTRTPTTTTQPTTAPNSSTTDPTTTTSTPSPTTTPPTSTTPTPRTASTLTTTGSASPPTPTSTPPSTSMGTGPITPVSTTTTDTTGPGFGLIPGVMALICVVLLVRDPVR